MRAMVTGGAGFIGSHIVESLLGDGHEVVSIDNYSAGKSENLAHLKCNRLQDIKGDILEFHSKWLEGVDVIFHNAASKKNICLKDPRKDLDVNAKGTFNVLSAARDAGVKKIVHASTGSVYGEAVEIPQTELHPLNPTSYYGISKLAGEKYAMLFSQLYNMDITVLRYFHVYGPRQDAGEYGGVVSIFANKIINNRLIIIFGDGEQERSFTYVEDVVKANRFVAENPLARGQVYNCASGLKITINELAQMLMEKSGKKVEVVYKDWLPGDIKKFDISNEKLINAGFEFKAKFEEGLQKVIDSSQSSPFYIKSYSSYDKYIEHQRSKYQGGIFWLDKYIGWYGKFLRKRLLQTKMDFRNTCSLCLGARQGTEVEIFNELGSFSVGLDVEVGQDNKYVVTGDASNIQYSDNSVDIVFTNALDHFLRIDETLSEINRVLKPNGYFIFLIGSPGDAKKDKHGSTYWDNADEVLNYLETKYCFKIVSKLDVRPYLINKETNKPTDWFLYFVVMQYVGA